MMWTRRGHTKYADMHKFMPCLKARLVIIPALNFRFWDISQYKFRLHFKLDNLFDISDFQSHLYSIIMAFEPFQFHSTKLISKIKNIKIQLVSKLWPLPFKINIIITIISTPKLSHSFHLFMACTISKSLFHVTTMTSWTFQQNKFSSAVGFYTTDQ